MPVNIRKPVNWQLYKIFPPLPLLSTEIIIHTIKPPKLYWEYKLQELQKKKIRGHKKLQIKFGQLTHNPFYKNTMPLQTQRTLLV
jgi:hypothetical protein